MKFGTIGAFVGVSILGGTALAGSTADVATMGDYKSVARRPVATVAKPVTVVTPSASSYSYRRRAEAQRRDFNARITNQYIQRSHENRRYEQNRYDRKYEQRKYDRKVEQKRYESKRDSYKPTYRPSYNTYRASPSYSRPSYSYRPSTSSYSNTYRPSYTYRPSTYTAPTYNSYRRR